MKRKVIVFLSILSFSIISATLASAQGRPPVPRPSQKASLMQTIGSTDVIITYSRPAIKGRTVFGDAPASAPKGEATLDGTYDGLNGTALVPFGHIWRSGANEATLFVVMDDVLINGQPLAAGRYSFHSIPGKDDWTFIFNKDDGQWGSFSYDAKNDVLRVKAKPTWATANQELLTFSADNVTEKSATFLVSWEKARVPFTVEVKDVVAATMGHLKAYVAAAKPDDPGSRLSAGVYAKANKQNAQATAWFEDALKINDALIATKETFQNLQRKATILLNLGRNADALAAAERALVVGKADGVKASDMAALEKRIADIKAGKQ